MTENTVYILESDGDTQAVFPAGTTIADARDFAERFNERLPDGFPPVDVGVLVMLTRLDAAPVKLYTAEVVIRGEKSRTTVRTSWVWPQINSGHMFDAVSDFSASLQLDGSTVLLVSGTDLDEVNKLAAKHTEGPTKGGNE